MHLYNLYNSIYIYISQSPRVEYKFMKFGYLVGHTGYKVPPESICTPNILHIILAKQLYPRYLTTKLVTKICCLYLHILW